MARPIPGCDITDPPGPHVEIDDLALDAREEGLLVSILDYHSPPHMLTWELLRAMLERYGPGARGAPAE